MSGDFTDPNLEERLTALEERLTALVEALAHHVDEPADERGGLASLLRYRARLATLRAPEDDAVTAESTATTIQHQRRKIVALQEQVAAARRERDHAVAILRETVEWARGRGSALEMSPEKADQLDALVARALLAARGQP